MGLLTDDMNTYVMGFFLSLSMINVWENTQTFFVRKKKLDALQWVSSICQIMNLVMHMIENTALWLRCDDAENAETIFFYLFQLGSGYVIIYRATALVTNTQHQNLIRYGLALILAASVGVNLASDILRVMFVEDGSCVPVFQRQFNDASKIILAVLYTGLLVAFIIPVANNIKRAGHYIDTTSLRNLATITAIKIIFAIIVQFVTVTLSLAGVFGEYFWIQFTIQNYSMIWASTVASRKTSKVGESEIALTSPSRKAMSSGESSTKGFSQIETQDV